MVFLKKIFIFLIILDYLHSLNLKKIYPTDIPTLKSSTNITVSLKKPPSNITFYINKTKISHFSLKTHGKYKLLIPPQTKSHNISISLHYINHKGKEKIYILPQKIHFFQMPTIAAIFPVSLPSTGGVVYIYGDYFSKLYDNATMKLNGKWQYNCNILFSDRLKCDITKMPTRKKNNYSISVVFENTVVRSVLNLNFYGINKISPSKGPVQKSTKVNYRNI